MHIVYINLDKRTDRRILIESELARMGLPGERFSAIEMNPGGLGCSKSHLEVIKYARERKYPSIFVIEDDFYFAVSKEEIHATLASLPDDYDVVLTGYNMIKSHSPTGKFGRLIEAQTTSGYIVHERYYDTLIRQWEEGFELYTLNPQYHWLYICDQYWKPLQLKDTWYYTATPVGYQRPGYSDNSNTFVDYQRKMTFVSAFFIPSDRDPLLPLETYKAQFDVLVKTGISIVLYLDERLDWVFPDNVKVHRTPLSSLWIESIQDVSITNERKPTKDTFGYMKIQHAKMECLLRTHESNPFNTAWFAWVDFGLGRLLDENTLNYLPTMPVPDRPRMVTPGCWAWVDNNSWKAVQWRFCGGFLMIHKDLVQGFWEEYKSVVLRELPKFTWEVNVWALMEWEGRDFGWVRGYHDTTIIPRDYSHCPWACVKGYYESLQQAGATLYPEAKKDLEIHQKRLQEGLK